MEVVPPGIRSSNVVMPGRKLRVAHSERERRMGERTERKARETCNSEMRKYFHGRKNEDLLWWNGISRLVSNKEAPPDKEDFTWDEMDIHRPV